MFKHNNLFNQELLIPLIKSTGASFNQSLISQKHLRIHIELFEIKNAYLKMPVPRLEMYMYMAPPICV